MKSEERSHIEYSGSEYSGTENSEAMLRRAAIRAANHNFYLASAFATYRRSENLDEAMLANFLGCSLSTLSVLSLCRRPGAIGETELEADLDQITSRFDVRRDRLVSLLREVEFLDALQIQKPSAQVYRTRQRSALLLAAQDRLQEEAEDYDSAETHNSAEADEPAEKHKEDHLEEIP